MMVELMIVPMIVASIVSLKLEIALAMAHASKQQQLVDFVGTTFVVWIFAAKIKRSKNNGKKTSRYGKHPTSFYEYGSY